MIANSFTIAVQSSTRRLWDKSSVYDCIELRCSPQILWCNAAILSHCRSVDLRFKYSSLLLDCIGHAGHSRIAILGGLGSLGSLSACWLMQHGCQDIDLLGRSGQASQDVVSSILNKQSQVGIPIWKETYPYLAQTQLYIPGICLAWASPHSFRHVIGVSYTKIFTIGEV